MKELAIKVDNLSKQYRLGQVGTGTFSHDLNRFWAKIRGKEDPYLRIGEENNRAQKGNSEYVWALKDINFEVEKGEVLGIIGRNGAGKSTLLKILSKVTGPTTGSIKCKGKVASLLEVGTGFHPELTGRENLYLNGTIMGMTRKEVKQKLDEIVEFAGVAKYIDTPVKRYSSGMRVRLGFAIAAHLEPDILVVDEVLAVGDAEFQNKAIGKMQEVSNSQGRTVLFVSHNMQSVKNLCTKVLIMDRGKVVKIGECEEMIKYYNRLAVDQYRTTNTSFVANQERRGDGTFKFSEITLLNERGEKIPDFVVKPGSDIVFDFKVEKFKQPDDFSCSISIRNPSSGENIFATPKYSFSMKEGKKNIHFQIRVKKLPLTNGEYQLYFWLGGDKIKEKYDILDDLPFLTIYDGKVKEDTNIIHIESESVQISN